MQFFFCLVVMQWRNNRACKACSARVQCTRAQRWGAQNLPDAVFFKVFWGEEGALLEYLHAGPLQPCYATVVMLSNC